MMSLEVSEKKLLEVLDYIQFICRNDNGLVVKFSS